MAVVWIKVGSERGHRVGARDRRRDRGAARGRGRARPTGRDRAQRLVLQAAQRAFPRSPDRFGRGAGAGTAAPAGRRRAGQGGGLEPAAAEHDDRRAVLSQIAAGFGAEGVLVQYTYGPAAPVPPELGAELGLIGERTNWVLANLPPAAVWRYRRSHSVPSLSRAA